MTYPDKRIMEDGSSLGNYKIENDSTIYWVQPKSEGSKEWEDVNVQVIEISKVEDMKTEEK